MSGWAQLKEAFWSAVDAGPSERDKYVESLARTDPEMARRLRALLAADARGESLQDIFELPSEQEPSAVPFRIGAYEVTGTLGAGGMGQVYRARDLRLNREVAVKVLPPAVVDHPEWLKRFEREAQLLASLNHPRIAQLYGLEESGSVPALVMEIVDGPTLGAVINDRTHAPMTLARALEIASQIADGLEAAHEAGVIHCDLKPGNVVLTRKGDVKILDFGLAKTLEHGPNSAALASGGADVGVMGTPAYMSPEQARGSMLEVRTDIWAFGCILYELLTGRQAFRGLTASDTLAAVLESEPELAILPDGTPPAVRSLLKHCLEKDPHRRLHDISQARRAIEEVVAGMPDARRGHAREGRARATQVVAGALLTAVAVALAAWWRSPSHETPLQAVPLTSLSGVLSSPSLSPDATQVAFSWTGPTHDNRDLYVQQIGARTPRRLTTNPGGDYHPSWSPDGGTIAFLRQTGAVATSEVWLIGAAGESERKLTEVQPGLPFGGLVSLGWCPDGRCVIVTDSTGAGGSDALFAVSLEGGSKRQLTYPRGRVADVDPVVSPDGRALTFRRLTAPFSGAFYRLSLAGQTAPRGEPRRLTSTLSAGGHTWTPDGRNIVFSERRALWRLDAVNGGTAARLPFVGQDGHSPVIARGVDGRPRLVYVRSVWDSNVWRLSTTAPGMPAETPPLLAITSTRDDFTPALSPDGRRVAFWSNRSGEAQIWTAGIDGSRARQVTSSRFRSFPAWPRWSPDGRAIAFQGDPSDRPDVLLVPAEGGEPRLVTADLFSAAFPNFSRDGRTLYFCRWDGPETRVWKMPVIGGPPVRVTQDPAFVPIESPDGRDLYYVSAADGPGSLWRVPTGGGRPVKVLDGVLFGNYDVVDSGIYYLDRAPVDPGAPRSPVSAIGNIRLQFFNTSTRRSTTIAHNLGPAGHGLSVSRDGRNIFFARIDSAVDELMVVDDFR